MFVLFNILFAMAATILDNLLGLTIAGLPYGFIYFLYLAFVFIPGLAVVVRRLHDIGKSGWMILLSLIPLVGGIWLLILMLQKGDLRENEYGPSPYAGDGSRAAGDLGSDILDGDYSSGAAQADTAMNGDALVKTDTADLLILLAIVWMTLSRILWFIMPKITESYYTESWFTVFNGFTTFVWACVPLGLAFAIKHPTKRMAMLVIGGLYLLFGLVDIGSNIFGLIS